jgi:threonine-phosphate decarboxylase
MSFSSNGGHLESIRRRLGLGDQRLIDFATGTNPLGPPSSAIAAARRAVDDVGRSVEPGVPRLTERIAAIHGVPVDRVIVGAGVTELVGLIGQSLREVLALHAHERGNPAMPVSHLVEPTNGAYRRTSVLNEMRTELWSRHILGWKQDFLPGDAAGVFWTGSPDSPVGKIWDRAELLDLVDRSLALLTVVDESYLPFLADVAERTFVGAVPDRENLLVLRSFTKFYGLAGLRVGYAVSSPDMVVRLGQYQDRRSVSVPAEAAALAALDDFEYHDRTVDLFARESTRCLERLWDLPGIRPAWPERSRPSGTPHPPSFLLVSVTESGLTSVQVQEALARRGFLVRECSDFHGLEVGALLTGPDQLVATRGHLRIALRTPAENDALLAALREILKTNRAPGGGLAP